MKPLACVLLQDHSILTLHMLQFCPGNEFLPSAQPALAVAERQTPHLSHQQGAPTGVFRDPNPPLHVPFFPNKGLDISGRYNPICSIMISIAI